MKQQYTPDLGKLRLEREEIDKKRDEYIRKLSAAREKLTWDNFTSVPAEKEGELRKIYHSFIAIVQSYELLWF